MWAIVPAAAFAVLGCVAYSPDGALPKSEVTLRHLRTEKLTRVGGNDSLYLDVFELRNHTDARLLRPGISSGEAVGRSEALSSDRTWQDADVRWSFCFGAQDSTVEPRASAEFCRSSWLRLSRFSFDVGVLPGQAISDAHARPVRWIAATSEPYDSPFAAPGREPFLTLRERADAK